MEKRGTEKEEQKKRNGKGGMKKEEQKRRNEK